MDICELSERVAMDLALNKRNMDRRITKFVNAMYRNPTEFETRYQASIGDLFIATTLLRQDIY